MSIKAVSHLGIGVRNMERSVAFYRDVLGMPVISEKAETLDLPDGRSLSRRAAYIRWTEGPHATYLSLDELQEVDRPAGMPPELFQLGVHHFGLWVDDLDALVERARSAGQEVKIEPLVADTAGEAPGLKMRLALLRDPDGNFVEINERV